MAYWVKRNIYLGAAPEYWKADFLRRLEREVYNIKLQYPDAAWVGIADGARTNWKFLKKHKKWLKPLCRKGCRPVLKVK